MEQEKVRRFSKYTVGKSNVDDMTRDQLLNYMRIALKDNARFQDELLLKLIDGYGIDLQDMPDEMLRELVKDYADACDDRFKASAEVTI